MRVPKPKKRGIHNTELICTKCQVVKPVSEFYWHEAKDYYDHNCKPCLIESRKKRNGTEAVVRGRRKMLLRDKYNLTLDEFDGMMKLQEGRCEICQEPFGSKRVCVDHNHSTGEVRALLCTSCNIVLGHAKENRRILLAIANYIEKYN